MPEAEPTLSTLAAERRATNDDATLLAVQRQHEEDLRKLREEHAKRIEGFALDILDRCARTRGLRHFRRSPPWSLTTHRPCYLQQLLGRCRLGGCVRQLLPAQRILICRV